VESRVVETANSLEDVAFVYRVDVLCSKADLGTAGLGLLDSVRGYDRLILVDAVEAVDIVTVSPHLTPAVEAAVSEAAAKIRQLCGSHGR
jgi:Ni,Fe-hydrogenase maturation factor